MNDTSRYNYRIVMQNIAKWRAQDTESREKSKAELRLTNSQPLLLAALKDIIESLPAHRDWLNPDTERLAKEAIKIAEGKL